MNKDEQEALDTLRAFAVKHETTVVIEPKGWLLIHKTVIPKYLELALQALHEEEPT